MLFCWDIIRNNYIKNTFAAVFEKLLGKLCCVASIDLYLFIWHHRKKYLIENFYNKETGNQAIKYDAHYIYFFWLYHLGEATSQMNSQKIIKIKRGFFLKKIIKEKRCFSRASEPNGKLRRKTINFINVEL